MKLMVWSDRYSYLAVAHAETVEKARKMLVPEIGGWDKSCPERTKAREAVESFSPEMWQREACEFVITDSEEVRIKEAEIERLRAELAQTKQQAVEIARGCRDYGGGYRSDDEKLAIYHHGMDTVERCLQAWANGDDSLQLRVVQAIGSCGMR